MDNVKFMFTWQAQLIKITLTADYVTRRRLDTETLDPGSILYDVLN